MLKPIMKKTSVLLISTLAIFFTPGFAEDAKKPAMAHGSKDAAAAPPGPMITPSPENAKCYIVTPKDGETVKGEFTVVFGLKGMGVAPAGIHLEASPTGHHHLLIDKDVKDLLALNIPLPKDEQHVHFGGGQTETTMTLPPGKHTLQLILGNWSHIPHDPPLYSEKITITVAE